MKNRKILKKKKSDTFRTNNNPYVEKVVIIYYLFEINILTSYFLFENHNSLSYGGPVKGSYMIHIIYIIFGSIDPHTSVLEILRFFLVLVVVRIKIKK